MNLNKLGLAAVITGAMFVADAPQAHAAWQHVRVNIYNSSSVSESQCKVFSRKDGEAWRRLNKVVTHSRSRNTKLFVVRAPDYRYVEVHCKGKDNRSWGKATLDTSRNPVSQRYFHVQCASSQPNDTCRLSIISGDP